MQERRQTWKSPCAPFHSLAILRAEDDVGCVFCCLLRRLPPSLGPSAYTYIHTCLLHKSLPPPLFPGWAYPTRRVPQQPSSWGLGREPTLTASYLPGYLRDLSGSILVLILIYMHIYIYVCVCACMYVCM